MFRWILVPLILMTTLTVAGGNQGPGAGQNEAVLAELQQALAKAWVSGDRATIERIIAPEWRSIGPDGPNDGPGQGAGRCVREARA